MSITINRTFSQSPDEVFTGLVAPESFAQWFGTTAVHVPLDRLDFDARDGNEWHATMILPDGSEKQWAGIFIEVIRPERLVFSMTDEPENPARSPIVMVLSQDGEWTALSMTQSEIDHFSPEQLAALTAGWNAFFDTLSELLSA